MAQNKIDSGDYTDMTNQVTTYESDAATTEKEITYISDWSRWYGIYKDISLLAALIDAKAMWTVGKGFKAKKGSKKRLDVISGNGKQTFNSILHNSVKTYTIGGDFYAEKIMDGSYVVNLMPRNPANIKIHALKSGRISGYEEITTGHKWSPEEIFHLPWNQIIDEIHGQSTVEKLESSSQAYKEAKADLRIIFHRYVKPLLIFQVDTDNETEIATFKTKVDKAVENAENMILPYDTLKNLEKMSIPQHSTLDPLPWIAAIERDFLIAEGVPAVIVGSGEARDTEAEAKILYLAFQQLIEWNQLFLEEQIRRQLGFEIELEFPASLEPTMQKDQGKARSMNNMEAAIGEAAGGKKSA